MSAEHPAVTPLRYGSIVADPPWELPYGARYGKGGRRGRKTEIPYSFMSVDEIMALPVADLADENAHLYLWSTRRNFREGIAVQVARAWGFEPRGELIWGLRNGGPGGVLGNGHEPVLIASRGDLQFPKGMPVSVVFWKQPYHTGGGGKIHSAKPAGLQDLVEQMSPGPYLEMFSRRARLGWDTWGDEALHGTELIA